jgi:hypothetical protein
VRRGGNQFDGVDGVGCRRSHGRDYAASLAGSRV